LQSVQVLWHLKAKSFHVNQLHYIVKEIARFCKASMVLKMLGRDRLHLHQYCNCHDRKQDHKLIINKSIVTITNIITTITANSTVVREST